jgi:predicted nucleotide-binding protein (sugar kinase/HSP70/actin superfamily)
MVYDKFLNLNLVNKLDLLGAQVWTLESFDSRALKIASCNLNKLMFWNYGSQALGCAYQLMDKNTIDGIIYLTCFGCGIDSFVGYMVERRLKKHSIPFTTISIDEHTGKAGIDTRLEAFIDTIIWRKEHEDRIPTHGQCIYSS